MQRKTCRAGTLAGNADVIAPVSGCRCRQCGANAKLRPPEEQWTIYNGAAYCPECAEERDQEQAGALAVPCERRRVPAGEKCKNYLGQNKQTCPDRGKPAAPPIPAPQRPVQPSLFE